MDDFFIYDGFTLAGLLRSYSYIKWTRAYNRAGEFTLETLATDDMRRLIKTGRIMSKGEGEAAFIEDFVSSRDAKGSETLTVTGRFLSSVLNRRIFDYAGTDTLSNIINAIIDQNFISPSDANRRIPELRRVSYTPVNNPTLTVAYEHADALEEITKLCQQHETGFRVLFNPNNHSFDFSLYEGKPTNAIFTENFQNVLEQDYYEHTAGEKTTAIVGSVTVGGNMTGLSRKEMFVQADLNAGGAAAQEQGKAALWDNRRITSFDTVLNMPALQFPYKSYWDLGDIVTCENLKWNARITDRVQEVTEYFDKGGLHITPVFGDGVPGVMGGGPL